MKLNVKRKRTGRTTESVKCGVEGGLWRAETIATGVMDVGTAENERELEPTCACSVQTTDATRAGM